jgi:hypothetical protein
MFTNNAASYVQKIKLNLEAIETSWLKLCSLYYILCIAELFAFRI